MRAFFLSAIVPMGSFACTSDPIVEACTPDPGVVCRVAGTGAAGANNSAELAIESPLYSPMDVTVWKGADDFFIGDWNNHKVRHVSSGLVRTIVGTDFLGDGDVDFKEREPPGVLGTEVALNHPTSAEWNPVTQRLLLPSWHNHRVREWNPETGFSLVVAADTDINDGNGANSGFAGDGGPAADALMAFPNSIAVDPEDGSFWLLPQRNHRIRWIAHDYSLIETVAGGDDVGYAGDGGDPLEASFFFWAEEDLQPEPSGAIEFDPSRRMLYIADTSNHVIRTLDVENNEINTLEGTGVQSLSNGACDPSALCYPRDVEILDDMLYIADSNNHVIRRYNLETGAMEVVVGTFESGNEGDGTDALSTPLNQPHGIDLAPDGTLLIADTYNHRILRVASP